MTGIGSGGDERKVERELADAMARNNHDSIPVASAELRAIRLRDELEAPEAERAMESADGRMEGLLMCGQLSAHLSPVPASRWRSALALATSARTRTCDCDCDCYSDSDNRLHSIGSSSRASAERVAERVEQVHDGLLLELELELELRCSNL